MRVLKPLISISDNVYYNPLKYEGSKTADRDVERPSVYYTPLKYEGKYTHAVGDICRRALKSNIKTGNSPGLHEKSGGVLRQMMS